MVKQKRIFVTLKIKKNMEKCISFKPEMVAAILDGLKTQTRRVVGLLDLKPPISVGDVLVCREAWYTEKQYDHIAPSKLPEGAKIWVESLGVPFGEMHLVGRKRPAMFMPKRFSRLKIKVTGVRLERLCDISELDAKSEGVARFRPVPGDGDPETRYFNYQTGRYNAPDAKTSFFSLWVSIHGEISGDTPVWVYNFELIK